MARVAIVTGGTRGIGEAISIALRDMGMKVAANYAGNEERARASRRWLLERAAEDRSTVFTAHFANTSAGHVTRSGDRFDWRFV